MGINGLQYPAQKPRDVEVVLLPHPDTARRIGLAYALILESACIKTDEIEEAGVNGSKHEVNHDHVGEATP